MADNVLKAVIDVSAPGAVQTFRQVAVAGGDLAGALDSLAKQGDVSLGSLRTSLEELRDSLKKSTDPQTILNLGSAIDFLSKKEKEILGAGADKHFDRVGVSSLRANSAALNLTRTFGIIPGESSHVAHSLESIIFAFENIRSSSGTTGEALKSLFSSIGSTVGLGLFITGISALVESFSGAEEKTKSVKHELTELEKEQQKLAEETNKAAGAVVSQASKFEDLKKTLSDTSNKYNELTKSIITQGVAQFLFSSKEEEVQKALAKAIENTIKVQKGSIVNAPEFTPGAGEDEKMKRIRLAAAGIPVELQKAHEEAKKTDDALTLVNNIAKQLGITLSQFVEKPIKSIKEKVREFSSFLNSPENKQILHIETNFAGSKQLAHIQREYDAMAREIERLNKTNPIFLLIKLRDERQEKKINSVNSLLGLSDSPVNAKDSEGKNIFTEQQKAALNFAKTLTDVVGPAIDAFIGAFKSGENPIKAFFQSIGQAIGTLIAKIIKAAITAAILNAILAPLGLTKGFGDTFSRLLGFGGGRASGGSVAGRVPYLVGEHGPEIFVPNTGGRIMSNGQSRSFGSVASNGGNMRVSGEFVLRGYDLVAAITKASQSQNRLT